MTEKLAEALYDMFYDTGCRHCACIPFGFSHESDSVRAEYIDRAERLIGLFNDES